MAPKRQRTGKRKRKAGSSSANPEFPDEFLPDRGFDVGYWDRDMEDVVDVRVDYGHMGNWSWRKICALREPCRTYMPSKYVDFGALDYFGIREAVSNLMESIGWTCLLTIAYYTNSSMLHEFYAYLKVTKDSRNGERIFTRVEFSLGGFSFDYSVEEFARIFWFDPSYPSTEKMLIEALEMEKAEFWRDVNDTLFRQEGIRYKSYKATALVSNDLKYVHRVLTHTINGRADSNGNVNRWDQIALYCMMKELKFNGVQMLLEMMHRHTREEFKGRACGGGLIMLLAVRHGFPPGGVPHNAARDNILVDSAAFSRVVYPPPPRANARGQQDEEGAAAEEDHHAYFRDIPDDFSLPLVAQLTSLQNDIQKLDLDYQEEERKFEDYSMHYYQQRYDSMDQWNSLYDEGLRSIGGRPGEGGAGSSGWADE